MFDLNFPDWDKELFIYLNSKNADWLDPIMILLSTYTAWFFLCIWVILLMLYKHGQRGRTGAIFLIGGLAFNTVLNTLIKMFFMRPRPGNEDMLKDLVILLEETGTSYSFFSGHSSNSFCLAVFTTLYFRNKIYGIAILPGPSPLRIAAYM
ncbi:MAG: phosphatase PAP2 family protein [Tannerellaceae bacterium]|nr:phosphatase PAP2 family protein [Tannerellaceae bacterium]